jgi:hypothetical protein
VMVGGPTLGVAGPRPPAFPGFEANHTAMSLPGVSGANRGALAPSALHLDRYTTNNVTMLAWVNPTGIQADGTGIFFSRANNGTGNNNIQGLAFNTYKMSDGDKEVGWCWNGWDYGIHTGLELPHNIWSLVAVVLTPTNTTLYICNASGIQSYFIPDNHGNATGGGSVMSGPEMWNAPTMIGYDNFNSGNGRVFSGAMADLAVLPVPLAGDQVIALYAAALGASGVPPLITAQPRGASVLTNATKQVSVAASGTAPLAYRWQARAIGVGAFTNLSDTANLSGTLSSTLAIASFNFTNVADYRVIVTNAWGAVTSAVATLRQNTTAADNSYGYGIFTNKPIAYWRMNEPVGSPIMADISPNGGLDASVLPEAILGSPGPVPVGFPGFENTNTCLQTAVFPDSDGYATFPSLNLNGPFNQNAATNFTITAWLNPADYQNPRAGIVFLKGTGNGGLNYSATFRDSSGYPVLGYSWNNGDGGWNTGLQPPPGIWSFVALVVTATDETMYLFNEQGMSMSYNTVANTIGTETFFQPGAIGADTFWMNWGGFHATFNGSVDEVAIFTNALSGSLLETLYAKAIGTNGFPIVIKQQPVSAAVVPGGSAQFSVVALGTGLSYQWQTRPPSGGAFTNLTEGGSISGSQTATLTVNNASAANVAQYQVVISNTLPSYAISLPVQLVMVTPKPPGLVGQWLTGSQDFADKSGFTSVGTHDGFIIGNGAENPYWSAGDVPAGFGGASYALDGNCAIRVTNSASSDPGYQATFDYGIAHKFTVAFWVKGFPPHGWNPIVTKGGSGTTGWEVRSDGGGAGANPTFSLWGTTGAQPDMGDGAPVNLNDYQWHHLAGTWDGATGIRHFYVDGVLEANVYGDYGKTVAIGDVAMMAVDATHHLELGAIEATGFAPGYFAGQLFDVRLYNYALSAGELQAVITPPAAGAVGLYLDSTNVIPVGQSEAFTLLIPAGANSGHAVTVWITNNAPGVALIEGAAGSVLPVTFSPGAPNFHYFVLDTVGAGQIQLTAGADSGLASATLAATVVGQQLIGRWFTGSPDLTDKSGFKPGVHNAAAATYSVNDGTQPLFVNDAPPGYTGQSLKFDGTYAIAIQNSCSLNYEGNYQTTFDDDIAEAFSVSFWAKGTYFPSWQPWVGKRGESSFGWKVRAHGTDNCPCFTTRQTGSFGNLDEPFNSSTRLDGAYGNSWHHYTATYDSLSGVRKLYVDGKLDASVLGNDFGPYGLAKSDYLTIGGLDNDVNGTTGPSFGNFLIGRMFDVRMYNYALDASEAQALAHPAPAALIAVADSPVIDQGQRGTVSVSLPSGANANQPITVWVTNVNPALLIIAGAPANIFSVTLAAGARASLPLTLTGQSDGLAQIGFSASGLTSASATVRVLAPTRLIGHWFAGHTNVLDHSGFSPARTHDGLIVGTPANLSYSSDVPPGFSGQSVNLNNGNNAANVAVLITNTCSSDNGYAPTFDDAIYKKFSITFWAKQSSVFGGGWVPWITKYGENTIGFKVRQNGGHNGEAFTLRGTYLEDSAGTYDDAQGNLNINTANQWYHIAAVWDGYSGLRKIYVNGVLDTSIVFTNDFGPFVLGRNHHLVIGAYENPAVIGPTTPASLASGTGFNGLLYDVRFYNYPLSAAEVQTVMTPIRISVLPAAAGAMHLSWPAASTMGYVLQTSSDLVNWTNSTLAVTTAGGQNTVTDTAGAGTLFYRLYLP